MSENTKKRKQQLRILNLPEDCLFEITNFFESGRNDFLSFILTSKVFYNLSNSKFFFGFSNVIFKPITKSPPSNELYFVHTLSLDDLLSMEDSLKYIKCFPKLTQLFVENSVDLLISNDFFEELKDIKVLEYEICDAEEDVYTKAKDNGKEKCLYFEKLKSIERLSLVDNCEYEMERAEIFSFSGSSVVNSTLKELTLLSVNFQNFNFLKDLSSLLKLNLKTYSESIDGNTVVGLMILVLRTVL